MDNYKEKGSNQILIDIKNIQVEYDAAKQRLLVDLDKLDALEVSFNAANKELVKRLNGNKDGIK